MIAYQNLNLKVQGLILVCRTMWKLQRKRCNDDGWKNILVSESNYWVKNGDFKKAIEVLDADKENYKVGNVFDASGFNKTKYDLISKIIEELLDDNEFNEARKWVLKCPDKHDSGIDFREEDGYYKKHKPYEKMRYILNKKIDEFEKPIKINNHVWIW